MNAQAWYEELNGETLPEKPVVKSAPLTESEKLRQWFNGLNLATMQKEERHEAEFFKHNVIVYRAERFFYLFTRSPQQRIYRRSLPTAQARGNAEDLRAGLECFVKQMEAKQDRHTAQREAKRQARAAFVNPYKVGNFLYSSWGYDQTNREFYQILEVRPRALLIREVSQNRERTGHDQGICSPRRDSFIKPPQWVTIQIDSRGNHSVPSPIHGILFDYEGKPVYFSDGY